MQTMISIAASHRSATATKVWALSSAALAALCTPAAAYAQAAPVTAEPGQPEEVNEIVVTARRGEERLQNVPVSVQVVTGDKLQELAITTVEEVSKLAPGLTLVNAGSATSVTLRGITWQPGSGTPATPIYFNEAPFDPGNTIVSLFDGGQIEVLRGPQGTTRGAPSISGAVTIRTRSPDLNEFGGYFQGLYGEGDHTDFQGALNVPVIPNVLAVRLAANIEDSNANRIRSVNSDIDPKFRDRTYRATVLFVPTDTISLQAMYQRRKTLTRDFNQVAGTGSPGNPALGVPANYNGPALSVDDRASVQDLPNNRPQHVDLLTVNGEWEVFDHTISANYGRQFNRSVPIQNALDIGNILPGFENFSSPGFPALPKFETKEIRISSLPDPDRPFSYDLGWFSRSTRSNQIFLNPVYLPGAFGAPFASIPVQGRQPDMKYVLESFLDIKANQQFDSFYGNVRLQLTDRTELTGGVAVIQDRLGSVTSITTTQALAALPAFLPPPGGCMGISAFLPVSVDYGPGFCQNPVAAVTVDPLPQNVDVSFTKSIYNFSLSHQFTEDLLVYATTGTSFRIGLPQLGNTGLPASLNFPEPESATSYELGVKASIGRAYRANLAVFQLDYDNQLTTFEGTQFFSTVPGAGVRSANVGFYRNIDAKVRGFELELAANPLDGLNLAANLSYSKIKGKGGSVPCNDPTRPLNASNPINFCDSPSGQTLNQQAPWQASVNGGYELPVTNSFDGYFRFNVAYQGKNPNFGNFRDAAGAFREVPDYFIVDLFAGLAQPDDAWDIGVYAKNVFDKNVELARRLVTTPYQAFAYPNFASQAGYDQVRTNLPREVGVTLRYAFGSR